MRILMLAQSYAPVIGGEERIVEDLSTELVRRGHEVGVATLRQPAGDPPESDDGVEVHLLGSAMERIPGMPVDAERRYAPPGPDPLTVRDLRRVLRSERPDVVHAHNWLVDSYLPIERSGPALVLSLHDYSLVCATKRLFLDGGVCSGPGARKCLAHSVEHYGAARGAMVALGTRFSEPWLRRRVDMFLSISAAVGELNRVGEEAHRVVPNFIGELPAPPPADDPRLAELPDQPFVLFFGDASEDKGARHLVEAYAGLEGAPPLVLIGRRLADELEAGGNAIALGPMPHPLVIEALRRSLFAVVPSVWAEPFGIVALETAAAGKAIVASDIGGLKDVVVDGETGLLVPAGDREALRRALRRLLEDEDLRERMGAAALRRARLAFGPDVVVPQFEDAYRTAVGARRSRQLP